MGVSIDGNNITITNATIELINGANPDSGVSYIIITPDGGVGQLPFMAQGLPGQPTLIDIVLIQLADGVALPVPNPAKVLLDPGGSGLPAKYQYTFYLNAGPTGLTGSPSISGASDLAASPVLGAGTDKYTLLYRNSDGKFVLTAQKNAESWAQGTIASTAFNNTSPRLLHTISIAAQPFAYRVDPFAQTVVTGSVDTRVDLVVRMNDPATGDQVGYGKGLTGINSAGIQTILIPAYPAGSSVPGSYGVVAINTAASFFLRAEQKAGSSNSWSTPASPDTTFTIDIHPLT